MSNLRTAPRGNTSSCILQHSTGDPLTGDPLTGDHLTGDPLTGDPLTGEPLTGDPLTGDPLTGEPLTGDPLTGEPLTGDHLTGDPLTGDPLTDPVHMVYALFVDLYPFHYLCHVKVDTWMIPKRSSLKFITRSRVVSLKSRLHPTAVAQMLQTLVP